MGSWQDTGSFLNSEGLVMTFIGEGEHFLIATAITVCFYLVLGADEGSGGCRRGGGCWREGGCGC